MTPDHHVAPDRPMPSNRPVTSNRPVPSNRSMRSTSWICRICLLLAMLSAVLAVALYASNSHLTRGVYEPTDAITLIIVLALIPLHAVVAITAVVVGCVGIIRSIRAPAAMQKPGPPITAAVGVALSTLTLIAFVRYSGIEGVW